jgi:prevent-host-death family protein
MMTMVMKDARQVSASRFKAQCLRLLDDVAETGVPLVVTKRGKPVARVVATSPPPSLLGSVSQLVDDDELIAPIEATWDAER